MIATCLLVGPALNADNAAPRRVASRHQRPNADGHLKRPDWLRSNLEPTYSSGEAHSIGGETGAIQIVSCP
jgi:hypothetical protein